MRGSFLERARLPRRLAVVGIVGMVASLFPAMSASSAGAPLPSDLDIVVDGGGYGHGHGMSQYGARAQAEAGRSWRTILDSYYKDIDVVDRGQESMRVLLASGGSIVVGGPERIRAKWYGGSYIAYNSDSYPYMKVVPTSTGVSLYKSASSTGGWTKITSGSGRIRFYPTDGSIVPLVSGGQIRYYRNLLEAYRVSSATLYTINQLAMDHYLNGVVPREMPAYWHESALRAQAVAARSYSSWKKANASSSRYDICATTQCQVYGGYGYRNSAGGSMTVLEHARTNEAVDATSGLTMVSGGDPIFAEFHSSSGGHTSQGSRSYLAPRDDPWDEEYSPYHRWTAQVRVSAIEDKWSSIGRLTAINGFVRDGDGAFGGRVESMDLVGTEGTVTISGAAFRSAFGSAGVRSTLFKIGIYDAVAATVPAEVVLEPGETRMAVVALKNTGNKSWPVEKAITLRTSSPKGRSSLFRAADWISATRASYITKDLTDSGGTMITPGQVAEFRFPVTAPVAASSGLYLESFRPVVDGITWFGSDVVVPVRVAFASASHLNANIVGNASFEAAEGSQPSGWVPLVARTGDGRDGGVGVEGDASLKLLGDPALNKTYKYSIRTFGPAGERLRFSAWNRSTGTRTATGSTIDAKVRLRNRDGSSTWIDLQFPTEAHDWTFRERTFTTPKKYGSIEIHIHHRYETGTTWFDGVRLARDWVLNGNFEAGSSAPSSWTIVNATSGDGRETKIVRSGRAAIRLIGGSSKNAYARQYLTIGGGAGESFRLSGWNRTSGSSATGGPVWIWARVMHADGTNERHTIEFPRGSHDWTYNELTFTTAKSFERIDVFVRFSSQTGTALFDEVTLGRAGATRTMSSNSGFELGAPAPGDWTLINASATVATTSASASAYGDASLHIAGADANVYARQYIPLGGEAGDAYVLSGYNKTSGSDPNGGAVQIWARVRHVDGTYAEHRIDFPRSEHSWQRKEATITTVKPYRRIDVFAKYASQTGDAWFDSVRLVPVSA